MYAANGRSLLGHALLGNLRGFRDRRENHAKSTNNLLGLRRGQEFDPFPGLFLVLASYPDRIRQTVNHSFPPERTLGKGRKPDLKLSNGVDQFWIVVIKMYGPGSDAIVLTQRSREIGPFRVPETVRLAIQQQPVLRDVLPVETRIKTVFSF
jgi:hypothetical protein